MSEAQALSARLEALCLAVTREPFPSPRRRRDRLARLDGMIRGHRDEIIQAIRQDVGHRAEAETRLAEITPLRMAIRLARRRLGRWMRPRRVSVPWRLWPARARVHRQPLGVVGIIASSHASWHLALLAAVSALAAGNRVMIRPGEHTLTTSALLARLAPRYFAEDELYVVSDSEMPPRDFAALPFDHLLFIGHARTGGEVARIAAEHLTPVTLELGGQSPVIVASDADLEHAARRIAFGKWFNAGQTGLAPDYVMIEASRLPALIEALRTAVKALHPRGTAGDDYSTILGEARRERLETMLDEARDHGCRIIPLGEPLTLEEGVKLPPTLVIDPTANLAIVQEEICGPWLPIIGVRDMEAALERVRVAAPAPALYVFSRDPDLRARLLSETRSAGVVFNDTLWQGAVPALPLEGLGDSGVGAYRGEAGFLRFSHQRSVLDQARRNPAALLTPPWRRWWLWLLRP